MKTFILMFGALCFTASVVAQQGNTWNTKKRNNGEFGGTFNHAGGLDKEKHGTGLFSGQRDFDFSGKEYMKDIKGQELTNTGKFGGSTSVSKEYDSAVKFDGIPDRQVSYPGRGEVSHRGSYYGQTVFGGGDHTGSKFAEGEHSIGGYRSHGWEEFADRRSGDSNGIPSIGKFFTDNKQFMSLANLYYDRVLKKN